jgi:excisionase family DNA binding protein
MSQVMDSVSASSVLPRALFTAEEVADAIAVSEAMVRQLTTSGDLPCRRIGRLVRYAQADIDYFIHGRQDHTFR